MQTVVVTKGVYWVAIPEADLSILCGCPADSVKLLMKNGLIVAPQKGGVAFETGPNAILLSDCPIQNESFANLSEFPVLQMLYRQGMIVPGIPATPGGSRCSSGWKTRCAPRANTSSGGTTGWPPWRRLWPRVWTRTGPRDTCA